MRQKVQEQLDCEQAQKQKFERKKKIPQLEKTR